jgi:hypothetical protein
MVALLAFYLVLPVHNQNLVAICNSVCLYEGALTFYLAVPAQSEPRRLCNFECLYSGALALYLVVPAQSEPRRLCNSGACMAAL